MTLNDLYNLNKVIVSKRSDNTYEGFDVCLNTVTFSLFSYETGEIIKDYSVEFDEVTGEVSDEYEYNTENDGGYGSFRHLPKAVRLFVLELIQAVIAEEFEEEKEEQEEILECITFADLGKYLRKWYTVNQTNEVTTTTEKFNGREWIFGTGCNPDKREAVAVVIVGDVIALGVLVNLDSEEAPKVLASNRDFQTMLQPTEFIEEIWQKYEAK